MQIAKTWCITVLISVLASGSTAAFCRPAAQDCLTQVELQRMDRDFWASFPSPDGFAAYAAPKFSLGTNITELSQSLAASTSGAARARSVAAFLAQHPDVFGSFKTAHDSAYLYYPAHDRSPDAVRTSSTFPAGQCVSEFNYSIDLTRAQCVAGQRVRAYSLSFIKDKGRVMLRTGVLGLDSCN
ncbi:hypothetical protein [Burkholderia vietnamiensis]|uniref:hypothetical protein n=1 Tax=Burkholderia vietnamiensis TaxID=60552 RepID=UPI0007590907|nr:hypothetical protein [Burkholderia vietnamiensis]KVR76699.1 hypothetical protein WK26_23390 [Burkholderia vietnamiensis]KVS44838.1 hypothetical protein WK35_22795 [Burkholderia vietnamiensis]MBR8149255.1 hypothetical protein [Burkholderia vietnamiensis]CAG9228569.1 conserved exported hypothetical protein [Burkholderia vietnamiensis]HDR9201856.1 hypothetical protein [Burkholderia vietnamiensis]